MPADKNIYSSVQPDLRPLISVIVPVYKVEKYLDRCINSIVNQTYRNLEIILVDDGSPDKCPLMCDEWQKKDERIRVIHKKNGGLSSARNAGLDIATGELIGFVDSDDFILPEMYEYLYGLIIENDADLSMCRFIYVNEEGIPVQDEAKAEDDCDSINVMSGDEALRILITLEWEYVLAWNKLYRSDIFRNIRYPEGRIHEDNFTAHHILGQCRRVAATNRKLYMYTQRDDSIMGRFRKSFNVRSMQDTFAAGMDCYNFLRDKDMHDLADITLIDNYSFIREKLRQGSYIRYFRQFNTIILSLSQECIHTQGIKMKLRPLVFIPEIIRNIIKNILKNIYYSVRRIF